MTSPAERYAESRRRAATTAEFPALADFMLDVGFDLDDFQRAACEALERGSGVLVCAPTGAGKTVVGEFAVHLALRAGERKCFYTTPIKALSNQKYHDLVERYGPAQVGLLTGDNAINADAPVIVMTTEVLRNMLYAGSSSLKGLAYVVMDEVHYLADRFRGAVWEEVIIHLPEDVLVVSLSATVSNAEEFGAWLDTVRGDTAVVVSEHRPVPLWQHVLAGHRLVDLFVTADGDPVAHLGPAAVTAAPDSAPLRIGDRAADGRRRKTGPIGSGVQRGSDIQRGSDVQRGAGRGQASIGGAGAEAGIPAQQARVNPELRRLARDEQRAERNVRGGGPKDRGGGSSLGGRPRRGRPSRGPSRAEVISTLDHAGLLPAITFIFSRAGCDAAVAQCLAWGIRLTSPEERDQIRSIVQARCAQIPEEDLAVLGYWEWAEALERGVAAHHAGLLPTFKEVVEELFEGGLVKAVFATETLALGVNMPARTVVLEKLVKWNGETHADVTPGEYTQLTGRAGRRGIDVEGHAVVLWQPGLDPDAVGGLASTRTYPLRSSFRPTYNMAVNLVGQVGRSRAREILETSFAQFQADAAVVGLAKQARKQEEALAGYAEAMTCHLGDFAEYARLRRRIGDRETALSRSATRDSRAQAAATLADLRRGDVIRLTSGRDAGWAVVVDPGPTSGPDGPRPSVLTAARQVRRISVADAPHGVEPITRVPVPKTFDPRSPQSRRDLASTLRNALGAAGDAPEVAGKAGRQPGPGRPGSRASRVQRAGQPPAAGAGIAPAELAATVDGEVGRGRVVRRRSMAADDGELAQLRAQLRAHPCHGCAEREDHARWAERWARLDKETQALTQRIESRTNTIARVFDRVCDLLAEHGYLDGDTVTDQGERLKRIYAESDLLVAECLRQGAWDDLDPAGLAACVSAVVYESRRDDGGVHPRLPQGPVRAALDATIRIWSAIEDRERDHRLDVTDEPDLGLTWAIHRWASGHPLESVLKDGDLAAGDFVRWCKQVVDLLGQVHNAAGSGPGSADLRRTAAQAVEAVRRGVVAYSSLV